MISVQSKSAGDLGYISFSKDELAVFRAIDHSIFLFSTSCDINSHLLHTDIESESNFMVLEEKSPPLRLIFTVGMFSQILHFDLKPDGVPIDCKSSKFPPPSNVIPRIGPTLDNTKNPERSSIMLARFSEDPKLVDGSGDPSHKQFVETHSEANSEINKTSELTIGLVTPGDSNYGASVHNTGLALYRKFEISGKLLEINQAISLMEVAIAHTTEGDLNFVAQLNNLGNAFVSRFRHTGELNDIESAILHLQRAVQLTSIGNKSMPGRLNNLSHCLVRRFESTGNLADIKSAISFQQKAIKLTPEGHADMPSWLNNL